MQESTRKRLDLAIAFLERRQRSSGEFATFKLGSPTPDEGAYVKTVFVTSFVLHALYGLRDVTTVSTMGLRACRFLVAEQAPHGMWHFHGHADTCLPADLDDTACVLAALRTWDVDLDYVTIARAMLEYRRPDGLFWTWALAKVEGATGRKHVVKHNDVDCVVNANVAFCFAQLGQPLLEVEAHLVDIFQRRSFAVPTRYYDPPFVFLYCLSRVWADRQNGPLATIAPAISQYLKERHLVLREGQDALQVALTLSTMLNFGAQPSDVVALAEHLQAAQMSNGSWPSSSFFHARSTHYGSPELSTAMALEALHRYEDLCNQLY